MNNLPCVLFMTMDPALLWMTRRCLQILSINDQSFQCRKRVQPTTMVRAESECWLSPPESAIVVYVAIVYFTNSNRPGLCKPHSCSERKWQLSLFYVSHKGIINKLPLNRAGEFYKTDPLSCCLKTQVVVLVILSGKLLRSQKEYIYEL